MHASRTDSPTILTNSPSPASEHHSRHPLPTLQHFPLKPIHSTSLNQLLSANIYHTFPLPTKPNHKQEEITQRNQSKNKPTKSPSNLSTAPSILSLNGPKTALVSSTARFYPPPTQHISINLSLPHSTQHNHNHNSKLEISTRKERSHPTTHPNQTQTNLPPAPT